MRIVRKNIVPRGLDFTKHIDSSYNMSFQYYHSDLYCEITLCLAVKINCIALCEIHPLNLDCRPTPL